jgi:hypothetical protein
LRWRSARSVSFMATKFYVNSIDLGATQFFIGKWSVFLAAGVAVVYPLFEREASQAMGAFALGLSMGMGCWAPLAMSLIYTRAPPGCPDEAQGLRLTVNIFTHMANPGVN